MAKALTALTVEKIKPDPGKRCEIPDPALSGLYLIVQPSGVKSFALRYRFAGKPKKLTLGRWPITTLAAARAAATDALDEIGQGNDPATARRSRRSFALAAQETDRHRIRVLVEQFDRRHLGHLKSGAQARRFLDRFVVEEWGERNVQTITKRDVLALLDKVMDSGTPTTANRVLAHARAFFNWCRARDVLTTVPTEGVKPPHRETTRDRILSDDELRWFLKACDQAGEPWGPMGKLLLLTGQRLREIAEITEDEIRGPMLYLSAKRTKNGRAHNVPLSTASLDVIMSVDRVPNARGLLFCTNGSSPVQGFHKGRNKIAAAMTAAAREERGETIEIVHWTFHDLRRSCATGMARLGQPVHVIEAVLNHVSGAVSGIAGVYNRHAYENEKQTALEEWGRHVMASERVSAAENFVHFEGRS